VAIPSSFSDADEDDGGEVITEDGADEAVEGVEVSDTEGRASVEEVEEGVTAVEAVEEGNTSEVEEGATSALEEGRTSVVKDGRTSEVEDGRTSEVKDGSEVDDGKIVLDSEIVELGLAPVLSVEEEAASVDDAVALTATSDDEAV
jgi:hypothetical protein